MNKLEVGMYVRTNDGKITKFIEYDQKDKNELITDYYQYSTIWIKDVVKASYNIIDLIEVGDYVNEYYVSKIWKKNEITHYVDGTPIKRKERKITIQAPSYGGIIHLENKDIKSVLTKEQFESMSYRIGE